MIEPAQLLLDPVDAAAQFINFFLTGNANVLKKVVAVAFDIPPHLFFQFRGLSPECLHHVVHKGGGLVGVQTAATDPLLGHPA